ncbi:hypothetical protein OGAPHI_006785 [Ogataea philodendri]|uniref:Uncharacterized protein n=1 Tax=Ogataea philodendri TaxID=1378263 RepID=A0A9P8NWW7_9ASCO|nr:uncharacterized protein OGAPHI_006785 [Ogataea philodendri]KAH3661378.1 hypothetical protein OGAPHI_006785 [Ogataea philodendri]
MLLVDVGIVMEEFAWPIATFLFAEVSSESSNGSSRVFLEVYEEEEEFSLLFSASTIVTFFSGCAVKLSPKRSFLIRLKLFSSSTTSSFSSRSTSSTAFCVRLKSPKRLRSCVNGGKTPILDNTTSKKTPKRVINTFSNALKTNLANGVDLVVVEGKVANSYCDGGSMDK